MTTYSPLKMTLLWLFIVLATAWPRIYWGRESRIAIWLQGNRFQLDRQAHIIRWTMCGFGIILIWLGWRLPFAKSAWDVLIVMSGSILVLVFVYVPDLAYYCRRSCLWLSNARPGDGED